VTTSKFERRTVAMKYIPILQELFESDTVIFLIVGIVIAVIMVLFLKKQKNLKFAFITSVVVYAICELLSNMHTNFMLEIILVFVGTVALGCCIGFLVSILIGMLRRGKQ
jgi:ABC-type transport system involved in cytochrome c biogenesis permease component